MIPYRQLRLITTPLWNNFRSMIDASDEWTLYWGSQGKSHVERNALLEKYVPFADSVAARICQKLPRAYSVDQAKSDAYMAMIESIPRYRYGHGACFETFVGARIFGAIMDSLRQQDMLSRKARTSGVIVTDLSTPLLIQEYQAFGEVLYNESRDLLLKHLPFEDQELLWYVTENNTAEFALRKKFSVSRDVLVTRLNAVLANAKQILLNGA